MGITVLSVEQLVSKAVDAYLTEKRALEKQLSFSTHGGAPLIEEDNELHVRAMSITPAITVDPCSSAALVGGEKEGASMGVEEERRGEEGVVEEKGEEKGVEEEKGGQSESQKDTGSVDFVSQVRTSASTSGLICGIYSRLDYSLSLPVPALSPGSPGLPVPHCHGWRTCCG